MKSNESTYRMVDCVYLLCVFAVFLVAALGERKSEETSGKKRPKKKSSHKVVLLLLWTETGENSRLSLRGSGYFWHPFTRVRY